MIKKLLIPIIIFTSVLSAATLAMPVLFDPAPNSGSFLKGGIRQFSINVSEAGLNTTNVSLFIKAQAETSPEAWDRHLLTCENYTSSDWFCGKNISLLLAGDDTVEVYFFAASDNFGNQGSQGTSSAPLNLTVDVNPPNAKSSNLLNSTHVGINQKVEIDVVDTSSGVNQSRVFFRYGNSTFNSSWNQMAYVSSLFRYNWTTSSLVTNGTYSVYFNATDNVGNTNVSKILDILIDNELPSITITSPSQGKTLFDTVNFAINVKDSHSGVSNTSVSYSIGNLTGTLSCSGTRYENNCSTTFDSTKLSDGSYSLIFSGSDVTGNQNNGSTQVPVNNTKVSVTVTYPSNGAYIRSIANINATINNIGPGISKLQLRWENTTGVGNWQDMTCSSDYKCYYTWDTSSFAETLYTFRFNVTGTLDYLVEKTSIINVDNTKPFITIQKPTETLVNGTITPSAIVIDGSGVNADSVKFNISSYSEKMTCTSFEGGKRLSCGSSFDTAKIPDGTYTLYFLASDLANNQKVENVQLTVYNTVATPTSGGTSGGIGGEITTTTSTTTVATQPNITETPTKDRTVVSIIKNAISSVTGYGKSGNVLFIVIVLLVLAVLGYVYLKRKSPWKTSY